MKTDQKSKVLDWLSSLVDHEFTHHFSDNFISVNIWDDVLTIGLDFRQPNQTELFEKLPQQIKGCLQRGTGKLVNTNTLYFKVSDVCKVDYPDITGSELIKKDEHQSGSGGWIDVGEYFYTYDWRVNLSDGTFVEYHTQKDTMDLTENHVIYKTLIQKREFLNFITNKLRERSMFS